MSSIQNQYEAYKNELSQVADYHGAIALLHWDNEVYAPSKSADFRAQQIATLSAAAHELATSAKLGNLLEELNANIAQLTEQQAKNVKLSLKDYKDATKLSTDFVKKYAKAKAEAYQAWIAARKANDFKVFAPALKTVVTLLKEQTELLGYEEHPYNALLDQYEIGATVAQLDPLFKQIREELVTFAKELKEKGQATNADFLFKNYNKDKQWDLGIQLLKDMGFDFEAGRQDISVHPFTTNFSPLDVRVTTAIDENQPMSMIGSCIHEGGHALYEQGLPASHYGLPLANAVSLGIHESQSRLWENNIGLSLNYWTYQYPKFQTLFPENLANVDLNTFYAAINQVAPNLIRIQADELHYHLHILVRYEIEKALIEGSIEVEDLSQIWNTKYKEFLGVEVPNDLNGVLQDVHWCEGLMGYFPTYSLGSFYAAQFFHKACQDIPTLETEIANGDTSKLLAWLRENIHQYGRQYTPTELSIKATGEPLNVQYFIDYVKAKYRKIYKIQ